MDYRRDMETIGRALVLFYGTLTMAWQFLGPSVKPNSSVTDLL